MAVELNSNGPLKNATLYQISETTFWDKTRPPAIVSDPTDEAYTIKIDDRLDLLAFQKYGDSAYGWVILLRNNMRLWPDDFVPGIKIYFPTVQSLKDRRII